MANPCSFLDLSCIFGRTICCQLAWCDTRKDVHRVLSPQAQCPKIWAQMLAFLMCQSFLIRFSIQTCPDAFCARLQGKWAHCGKRVPSFMEAGSLLTLQWSAHSHRGNAPLWPQGTAKKKASPVLFVSILEFDLTETLEAKGLACALKQDPQTTDVTWSYIFFFFFSKQMVISQFLHQGLCFQFQFQLL